VNSGTLDRDPVQEYDIALKLLLQQSGEWTLRELTGVGVRRWLNVELPEVRGTRVDLLGESDGGELVHIELQSTNDPKMPLRMAEYYLGVYRRYGKFPHPVLLYVGEEPLQMAQTLESPDLVFRYRAADIRDLDVERLLNSERLGDNVIAVLGGLRSRPEAVRRAVVKIAALAAGEREVALSQLLILAGLRRCGVLVEQEARKMPILNDILDHEVLGREFKKGLAEGMQQGELNVLRRLIESRFGSLPVWAAEKLAVKSAAELEEMSMRVLDAQGIEDLLQ